MSVGQISVPLDEFAMHAEIDPIAADYDLDYPSLILEASVSQLTISVHEGDIILTILHHHRPFYEDWS